MNFTVGYEGYADTVVKAERFEVRDGKIWFFDDEERVIGTYADPSYVKDGEGVKVYPKEVGG